VDTDFDGHADEMTRNLDGDDTPDVVARDTDGDGVIDTATYADTDANPYVAR
jgi:hypothetical protein